MKKYRSPSAWSTETVRAARSPKGRPSYVPPSVWKYYQDLRLEEGLSINGMEFKNVPPSKQKKTLDTYEDLFDRLFYGDAAEEMWRHWNKNYKDRGAVAFTKAVFLSSSQLDVFRRKEAITKKRKAKHKIVAASKKLRALIQSEDFILGLKAHSSEMHLVESLNKLESFVSGATYGYDFPWQPASSDLARKDAMKTRKSVPHVDFLRQLAINLSIEVHLDKDLNFLILLLECFHPAPADKPYTIENVRRNLL